MTLTHCRRGECRHRVSNKHLAAGRDEFVSRSGDRPEWMLDENLHHTSASRESSRRMPGCLIRTFRYLTIIWAHQHGDYYYLGREAASQEMVSLPGRAAEGEEGVAVHRFVTTRRPEVVGRGSAESREQGGVAPTQTRTLLAQAERDCRHRPGALPPRRDESRAPCARARWTPDPSPPELPPVSDFHFQERAKACHHFWLPSDRSFFYVAGAPVRHGIWGFDKLFVNGNWIHMQSAFPPTPRYRTASTSGGSLPCSPATWVCSVHIAWQQPKQERWVTPHPLPPSPTHHYDDCPVVPASWGRVGQSPKPPVTRRGKPRHWAPRGANPMSPLLVPDPRAPSGVVWRHVRHTSGPALTTHQPWRAGQVSPILIVSLTSRSKRQMQRNEGQN